MQAVCYVPNCTGHLQNRKRGYFSLLKESTLCRIWEKNIPREGPFKPNDKVCDLYFEEDDVVKGYTHTITRTKNSHPVLHHDGEQVFYPLQRWKIKDGAQPRIFPSNK